MDAIVYTDLDGTLLDHHDYSFSAALPAIELLNSANVPIIPVTSKTRAELAQLREQLKLTTPFIVENGAAVFIPQTEEYVELANELDVVDGFYVKAFSPDQTFWSQLISELSEKIGKCFQSFSQMNLATIVELTGLTHEQAALAATREYSDPIYWFGNEAEFRLLTDYCATKNVQVVRGGRFVHLLKGANKGHALTWLHQRYQEQANKSLTSIALGDGENDVAMLQQASIAVQIRNPKGEFPEFKPSANQRHIQTDKIGPSGWHEAITSILKNT